MRALLALVLLAALCLILVLVPRREAPPAENDATVTDPTEDAEFLEPARLPGGIADLSGRTGYFGNPEGGIDAVSLETGEPIWHSEEACLPLIVCRGLVLALERPGVDPFRIVGLDVRSGKRLLASDPIRNNDELPGVRIGSARIREGQLYLDWGNYVPGATAHAALVDVQTGRVTRFPKDDPQASHPSTLDYLQIAKIAADAESMGPRYKLPAGLELEDPKPRELFEVPPRSAFSFSKRWIAGSVLALHLNMRNDETNTELLVCWDLKTGKHLHSVVMHARENPRERSPIPSPVSKKQGEPIEWGLGVDFNGRFIVKLCGRLGMCGPVDVLSIQTGKWLPSVPVKDFALGFCAAGPRLFYRESAPGITVPPLKAVDMVTQRVLWQRPAPPPPAK